MWKQKGQGIVEYALLLAFIVAIGGVLYSGNLADSIRSVFSNVNTTISPATTADEILERLRKGRFEGLAADMLDKKEKTLVIASDSPEGEKLAQKLNIQTKPGDAWFARVQTDGQTVFSYYSAAANKGMTFETLKKTYKPGTTVKIDEGWFNSRGQAPGNTPYFKGVPGHVGVWQYPNGPGIIIDPTPIDRLN